MNSKFIPATQMGVEAIDVVLEAVGKNPREKMLALSTVLENVVGDIPDATFEAMIAKGKQPCGVKGCICHISMAALGDALVVMRRVYSEIGLGGGGGKN